MSERSDNLKRILSEIGDKFEELFQELKKEVTEDDGEVNSAYHSFRSKMKEAEDDVKQFLDNNKDTIDKFKNKFEEIGNDIDDAFDRAFKKGKD